MATRIGISADVALNSHKTFYRKKWQCNNFYPIYKFVWREDEQGYEEFTEKVDHEGKRYWLSLGCPKIEGVTNHDLFKYIFEHNSNILGF